MLDTKTGGRQTRALLWYHREKRNEFVEGAEWCVGVLERTKLPGTDICRFFDGQSCHAGLHCPHCGGQPATGSVGFVVNGAFQQIPVGMKLKNNDGGKVESASYR